MLKINLRLFADIAGAGVGVSSDEELKKRKATDLLKSALSTGSVVGDVVNGANGDLAKGFDTQKRGPIGEEGLPRGGDNFKTVTGNVDTVSTENKGPDLPQYTGMSADDLRKALSASAAAGINGAADSQLAIIRQNLLNALSDMEAEKANGQANLGKELKGIADNQFATTELSKERMNQGGWDMNNSGLAVGEVGKIGIAADQAKANSQSNLTQILNDIARRTTQAKQTSDANILGVEKDRANRLAGAEADAMINAENTAYSRYRDSVGDSQWAAGYKLQTESLADSKAQQKWSNGMAEKQASSVETQNAIANAWQKVNSTGVVDAETAKILGIPEGTSTLEANRLKLDSDLAIAGVTGVYNGQPTLAGKEFNWNTDVKNNPQLAAAVQSLKQDKATFDEWVKQAPQRLSILNAQVKAANNANDLATLQRIAEQQTIDLNKINLKYAPAEAKAKLDESRASINNINSQIENRKKELAISQQNADTAAAKGSTDSKYTYKTDPAFSKAISLINQNMTVAAKDVADNAESLINQFTYDGWKELVKQANPKKTNEELEALYKALTNK